MTLTTLGFDGDDTLWHHENYFIEAYHRFQVIMDGVGYFPDAEKQAMDTHIANLTLWGYGVKSYVLSCLEAGLAMTGNQLPGSAVEQILDMGRKLYQHPVHVIDHVKEALETLKGQYRMILITKGDLLAQEMKVTQSGLAGYFDAIEIVSEKNTATYTRILRENRVAASEFLMVGNSIKSDIVPVLQIGGKAIHIPYHTSWAFETLEQAAIADYTFGVLPSMQSLPQALKDLA